MISPVYLYCNDQKIKPSVLLFLVFGVCVCVCLSKKSQRRCYTLRSFFRHNKPFFKSIKNIKNGKVLGFLKLNYWKQ